MRRAPVVAIAFTLALTGCGGDDTGTALSKDEYEQRFQEIVREAEESAPASTAAAETPQEQAQEIDSGLDRLRSMARELGELEPPPEIAGAHATFVEGMRALADDAERLVEALRAGREQRAEAMLDRGTIAAPATVRKIAGARHEFSEKGYDLGEVSEFP